MLDDEDADPAISQPAPVEKSTKESADNNEKNDGAIKQNGDTAEQTGLTTDGEPKDVTSTTPPELPSQVRAKLRKLEKLEATYPGWSHELLNTSAHFSN